MVKYRSWNEQKQRFYYFCNGEYYAEIDCTEYNKYYKIDFNWENAEQFIGMTINKVEIFAGDILEFEDAMGIEDNFGEVVWIPDEMNFSIQNDDTDCLETLYNITPSRLQRIGNIHENPRLVENYV